MKRYERDRYLRILKVGLSCDNLLMAANTPEDRLDRIERVLGVIAEDHVAFQERQEALQKRQEELQKSDMELRKLIAELATETRRGFDRVAEQFAETDRRFRETDRRFRQTDERIDKLVSAIGEFIRQEPPRSGPAN